MIEITQLLHRARDGDRGAAASLMPLVYDELRKLALHRLRQERSDHTLQATALVHEAYVRLVQSSGDDQWDSRGHFFSAASEAMRRILVDSARRRKRLRHGGGKARIELDDHPQIDEKLDELIALDELLERLAEIDPQKAAVVKLRFFGGLTMTEIAETLGISLATAERYWAFARAWLYAEWTA